MSNYTIAVAWSGKDALSDSDAAKVISGSDFNTEFTTVQTAINSKAELVGSATQAFAASILTVTTANITTVDFGDWTITEDSGVLKFATGGVNKMKIDASGNLTVVGDVTAYGTI